MKVKTQIEYILGTSDLSRNSDDELIIEMMRLYNLGLTPRQEDTIRDMPSFETIRRIRQKLQESGKYLANKEVFNQRQLLADEQRKAHHRNNYLDL